MGISLIILPYSFISQENFIRTYLSLKHLSNAGSGKFDGDHGGIFIVLEYCDSGTLASYLNRNETAYRPPWFKRIGLLLDVSEGMAYLHFVHNCIHRDLKSANVLLNRERNHGVIRIRAKVADFGLARFEIDDARK